MYEIFHRELAHDLFNARFSTITPRVDNAIAAAAADDVISISDVSPEKVSLLRDEFPVNFPRPFGMRSVRYVQRTRLLRTSYNASRIRSKRRVVVVYRYHFCHCCRDVCARRLKPIRIRNARITVKTNQRVMGSECNTNSYRDNRSTRFSHEQRRDY